jgi:hypothetical protein
LFKVHRRDSGKISIRPSLNFGFLLFTAYEQSWSALQDKLRGFTRAGSCEEPLLTSRWRKAGMQGLSVWSAEPIYVAKHECIALTTLVAVSDFREFCFSALEIIIQVN